MNTIPNTFFIVSNKVSRIGYNGVTYKTGDKIEINENDLAGFDSKWLITINDEETTIVEPETSTNPKVKETTTEVEEVAEEAEPEEEEAAEETETEEEEAIEETNPVEETEPNTEETIEPEGTTTKRGRKKTTE